MSKETWGDDAWIASLKRPVRIATLDDAFSALDTSADSFKAECNILSTEGDAYRGHLDDLTEVVEEYDDGLHKAAEACTQMHRSVSTLTRWVWAIGVWHAAASAAILYAIVR